MKSKSKQSKKKKGGFYFSQVGKLTSSDSDIDVEYEVQKILSHRIKKKYELSYFFDGADNRKLSEIPNDQLQFLVHWKGYDSNFQTWEPGQNLQNAPTIINQYKQKYSHSMHSTRANSNTGRKVKKSKARSTEKNGRSQPRAERPTRGLKFDKVFEKEVKNVKEDDESDELCFIDKVTFVQRTKNDKNRQKNTNIQNSQQRQQNSSEVSAQFRCLRKGKSFEIEVYQQQIPTNQQLQEQVVEHIDEGNRQMPEEGNPQMPEEGNPQMPEEGNRQMPEEGNRQMPEEGNRQMPENYCREFQNQPIEMPSRSLSSYLNQSCSNQKNESKMVGNNVSKQNEIKDRAEQQIKERAELQNSDIQIQEMLKLYHFKKRSQAELANIFDDSQNSDEVKEGKNQSKVAENKNNQQQQQDKQGLVLIGRKNKDQQHLFQQVNIQINKKRENLHEYNPQQTGQNIAKKLKLNTQTLLNSTQTQKIAQPAHNLQQHPKQLNLNTHPNEEGFEILLRKTAEAYLTPLDAIENIPKISLTERIDRQIKSLYEIQPINLLQSSDQSNGSKGKQNLSNCTKAIDTILGYKNCRQCNKTKNSYDLLVDYMKYHLKELNGQNCTMSLQKIYEEQQTFVLVNGLNPNIDMDKSDKIKKLLMLQNQQYLQNVIMRKAAVSQQVDEIVRVYKLAKIVWVRGQWFGVFKTQKLIVEKSHYRYVRMRDLARSYKQKIVGYLIEKE